MEEVSCLTLLGVRDTLCFLEEETEVQRGQRLVPTPSGGRRGGDLARLPGTAACTVLSHSGGLT